MSEEIIPVIYVHEEGTVWLPGFVFANQTIKEATEALYSTVANILVWKKDKELRMVRFRGDTTKAGEVLDPNAKVKDVIKPFDILVLVYWPAKEEWWKPENQNDDIYRIIREVEEKAKDAPRSPTVLFKDDFERLSIIKRLEREGKLRE
ncbi:hypothetical protein BFU36_13255 [Sulfolobus sp. A20]|uniref:hypothetical protein n=1 Tax=Sulfolobaceae TaxID=118883 RepID=UPI00084626E7|nr:MULTISPECIES: hypothetical protein [unclassified Sulfolobus]TRM75938.1 hypothetical protein DJ532_08775 [Sulfolobus sp. A20-N-F8]TRM76544.1 hypothetical protein DJ523_00940 [Sulfolobus sp. E5]TRM79068.1 hypothetical protein DJ528_02965 [Sulfolobus sp. B5]TRM82259.1 hypothetical protein DJ524_01305 [Sulfolobus sp. D5]TRM85699.1 hypothetical protein DJ521_07300 [Sulfolobus sp. E3]TRM87991.1 hypothetical protein DJ529_06695 [Sulfolobus sp. C3]TRM93754.1 hypothetical protein DJ526_02965 [Sulf